MQSQGWEEQLEEDAKHRSLFAQVNQAKTHVQMSDKHHVEYALQFERDSGTLRIPTVSRRTTRLTPTPQTPMNKKEPATTWTVVRWHDHFSPGRHVCDVCTRKELHASVVSSGGTATFQRTCKRVTRNLTALAPFIRRIIFVFFFFDRAVDVLVVMQRQVPTFQGAETCVWSTGVVLCPRLFLFWARREG